MTGLTHDHSFKIFILQYSVLNKLWHNGKYINFITLQIQKLETLWCRLMQNWCTILADNMGQLSVLCIAMESGVTGGVSELTAPGDSGTWDLVCGDPHCQHYCRPALVFVDFCTRTSSNWDSLTQALGGSNSHLLAVNMSSRGDRKLNNIHYYHYLCEPL